MRLGEENGLAFAGEVSSQAPLVRTAVISGDVTRELAFEASALRVAVVAEKPISFRAVMRELEAADLLDPARRVTWCSSEPTAPAALLREPGAKSLTLLEARAQADVPKHRGVAAVCRRQCVRKLRDRPRF